MVDRLSPILKEEGAEAISFSLIRTERMRLPELDLALKEIDKYKWIVFTSANGVECFFEEMQEIRKDIRDLAHIRFAVIGDGTKKHWKTMEFSVILFRQHILQKIWQRRWFLISEKMKVFFSFVQRKQTEYFRMH